jgi:hypothetical protein
VSADEDVQGHGPRPLGRDDPLDPLGAVHDHIGAREVGDDVPLSEEHRRVRRPADSLGEVVRVVRDEEKDPAR